MNNLKTKKAFLDKRNVSTIWQKRFAHTNSTSITIFHLDRNTLLRSFKFKIAPMMANVIRYLFSMLPLSSLYPDISDKCIRYMFAAGNTFNLYNMFHIFLLWAIPHFSFLFRIGISALTFKVFHFLFRFCVSLDLKYSCFFLKSQWQFSISLPCMCVYKYMDISFPPLWLSTDLSWLTFILFFYYY